MNNLSRPYPSGFGSSPTSAPAAFHDLAQQGNSSIVAHPIANAAAVHEAQAQRADGLFHRYRAGSSLFASPRTALLAQDSGMSMEPVSAASLARCATQLQRAALREGHSGVLLGAVPFLPDAPARLFSPRRVERSAGAHSLQAPEAQCHAYGMDSACVSLPSAHDYQRNVAEAVARIRQGALEKVVMSRALHVTAELDLPVLLRRLACRNTRGYTYAIELDRDGGAPRTLIGASPELLLARHGRLIVSNPLAGSIPRSTDPAEDARRAQALLSSAKDRHEHALVVAAVERTLTPYCRRLLVPARPSLVSTATMWHLASEVRGELADPSTTSLELALALHPTPAVCGHPSLAARDFINDVEGFDRGFFTGLVGWCDADGDGEWAVTIRCAVVAEGAATLYAGAGIVGASDPALELAETSAKLRTMLGAMGLDSVLETMS